MKICVAGAAGAFGRKHLEAITAINEVEVVSIVDTVPDLIQDLAKEQQIEHWTIDLNESLARPDIEAVILATPTPLHAAQAIQCLQSGKHVLVEIPMAEKLVDAESIVKVQRDSGRIAIAHVVSELRR